MCLYLVEVKKDNYYNELGIETSLKFISMKGYMYILKCSDDSYYSGSTKNLDLRLKQHLAGEGANHTKKHLPIELVYF